jgi:endonuclease/exonuclease/phosphatase family metal-dependent hydrolase
VRRPPRAPEIPAGPHLKVLTFNVNYGAPGPDAALAAIREADADLVCLQETTPAWEAFLRAGLGDRYPNADFHHARGAGGSAVLTKFPLRRGRVIPSAVGWFPALVYTADTPLGAIQVLNLHLHPAVSEAGSFTPAAYLSTSPAARLEELREIERHLNPELPALLLGDFNEGDSGAAIARLRERGFKDALPEFDAYSPTWRWRTSLGFTVKHRLDHVLYSPHWRCAAARVIAEGASDHFPVVAVLERAEGEPATPGPPSGS